MSFAFQILCVLALVACGFFARRRGMLTAQGTQDFAHIAISITYPALIFASITSLSMSELLANISLPFLTIVIGLVGFGIGVAVLRLHRSGTPATRRAFLFNCLINNYSFLPLPLVLFRYGERGVGLLLFSTVGYELLLWTLGVMLFTRAERPRDKLRGLCSPPFLVLMISLVFVAVRDLFPWPAPPAWLALFHETAISSLRTFGNATIALAMLVAGSRFATLPFAGLMTWNIGLVSTIRLLIVPLIMLPLLAALPITPIACGILSIVAVMPCAMISVLFCERYGGDADFIAGTLLVTHLAALFTVPLLLAWVL